MKRVILATFFLGGLYLATRLINLTLLPIFTDEAIYIRWSQIGAQDANWRFISLTDGKQPMFTWIAMVLLRLLHGDPLFIGRLVSVFAGAASALGIAFLGYELFRKKSIALWSSLLYVLSPFALLYDRMALYDSLVAAFSIWNLYLAILLVKRVRLDIALLLGMTLGLGMLNKTSGFLSLYLLPVTLFLFDWKKEGRGKRLGTWVGLALVAAILSQALYSVLRLSPLLHMVKAKDALFIYPWQEWMTQPFRFVEGNLRGMFDWLWRYISFPIVLIIVAGFFIHRMTKERVLLLLWWVLPFVALATFGKVLYPRFILFMTMPLLVLAAATCDWILSTMRSRRLAILLFVSIFIPNLYADYYLLTNPAAAPIPKADTGQYVNDWPAGGGVRESIVYLKEQSSKGPISIYTEGTFGLLPYAIEIYLVDHPNVKIGGIWPLPKDPPAEMGKDALVHPTFFILNQTQIPPAGWPLVLIAEYQKGINGDKKLRLYRVMKQMEFAEK
ncbi:glycosyltransferase family 39 protein [Candidatus Gottesmanbacteria bacterium]|nr:glycosyltransferase family 39 protein [Candidatus Gottesmanbacteria bacterium]